jgi:hypothetical protein
VVVMTTSLQFIFAMEGAGVGPVAFVGASVGAVGASVGASVGATEGVGVGAFVVGDKVGANVEPGANVVGVAVVGVAVVGATVFTGASVGANVRAHALSAYATLFTVMRLQPCHQS